MKRWLSLFLAICLLCPLSAAFAAEKQSPLTGNISEQIETMLEKYHAKDMLDDVKDLLEDSAGYTDEELESRIREIAKARDIDLSEKQIDQIVKLCRTIDKGQALKSDLEDGKEKVSGFIVSFRAFAQKASVFFQKLSNLFGKLS